MSKVLAYYHIVFSTRERHMTLPMEHGEHLYRFIWKELTDSNCRLLRIGGIQNHIHLLIELHPGIALSSLIRDLKSHSSGWLRRDGRFPYFAGWSKEYYAATLSASQKDVVIEYIKNQPTHHRRTTFDDELQELYRLAGLTYDARDMR